MSTTTCPPSGPATLVAACKRKLRSTPQWEGFCQRSEDCMSALLAQPGQPPGGALSEADRIALIEQAKRDLARDGQLAELKAAVRQMLTQALSEARDGSGGGTQGDQADGLAAGPTGGGRNAALRSRQSLVVGACQYLMLKWPHLTKQLTRYVLCPFPAALRPVLWGQCLRQGSPGRRLVGEPPQNELVPFGPSQLASRCQAALSSSPLLSVLQQWPHTLRAMMEAVESLAQQDSGHEGVECVLVLPFVYVHMGSVPPGMPWEEARSTVDQVVQQYGLFMRSRPWHLCSTSLPVARDAAAMFCGKVNRLLISADPQLHSSLCSSLTPPPMEEGPTSPTQDQFVRALRDVLHPLMAQFFVGTVPLSVVCVVLDQHLLSLVLPGYDPLPFCVAGLLLLCRRELLRCRSMDQVKSALNQQGPKVTPQALLSKVKQWFAGEVSQQVKVSNAKFTLREDDQETAALRQQVHSLEALLSASSPARSAVNESSQPNASADQTLGSQLTQTGSNQQSHASTGSNHRSAAGSGRRSTARSNQGSTAGSIPRSMARSAQRLAAGSNQGSATGSNLTRDVQAERPPERREVHLTSPDPRDPSPLSHVTSGERSSEAAPGRPTPVHVTNLVSVSVAPVTSPGPQPSAAVAQSGHAVLQDATTAPPEGLPPPPEVQQTLTTAWSPMSNTQVDSSPSWFQTPPPSYPSTAVVRTRTPDPIARSRAQEFWLHVLSRFSDALYLMFHGTEEEARELERQLAADQDSVESL